MKKYVVRWQETKVFNVEAEVYADCPEAAIKKAQCYNINENNGEWTEEYESHTYSIDLGNAVEIKE